MDKPKSSPSERLFSLSGKTACVTGASSGLGRHVASYLAQNGVTVVGIARREEQLVEWQASVPNKTYAISADLSDKAILADIASHVIDTAGNPDILINAAGINTRQAGDDVTPGGWATTLDLNLTAPFFLAQSFVPGMKKNKWGRIVNFASLQTYRAFPGGIAYGATKAGIAQVTRAMAEDLSLIHI